MTNQVNKELYEALLNIGLSSGDTVYVHSQLFSLGPICNAQNADELCRIVLDTFTSVIGPEGTLVVPTFTTTVARCGGSFHLNKTSCDTGIFAEFVRKNQKSTRSLHPINSVAALGPLAGQICEDVASTNYGFETPFHRMLRADAKAVNLGFNHRFSNSWHHHAETTLNLPYLYNKLLDIEVWQGQKRIDRPFYASLRYLDFDIQNDLAPFDQHLLQNGKMIKHKIGRSYVTCISARTYFNAAISKLKQNPWAFLKSTPKFRSGEIPWDGVTGK